jgi:MYXO-CTERM domain-containing protein
MEMKRLVAGAIFVGLLFIPRSGSAQSITLPATLQRNQIFRVEVQNPLWINLADCLADDVLRFNVSLTGFAGLTLEVWAAAAGVDCTPANERQPGGAAECWLVQRLVPVSSNTVVEVRAQDVVARVLPLAGTQGVPHANADACTNPLAMATALMFMLTSEGKTIWGTPQFWKATGFDTDPPPAPDTLEVAPGPAALHLSWTGTPSSDVLGFQPSCEQPPGNPAPLEMLDDVCQSDLLPGAPSDSQYSCGPFVKGANANSATLTGLTNDLLYAAAVSAVDRVGNSSVLSPVACATPVSDVSAPPNAPKIAREPGCGCSTVTKDGSLGAAWLFAGLGLLVIRRRRRGQAVATPGTSTRSISTDAVCSAIELGS